MSRGIFLKSLFILIALASCLVITFRPIPSTFSGNDTGRYVENQRYACTVPPFSEDASLPTQIYDLMARPACAIGSARLFLFLNSLCFPAAIVLFMEWDTEGALLLALGLLFSTISFELMTNALRQAASIMFLLAALRFDKRTIKILALIAAMLIHDSSWVFAPLVFVASRDRVRFRWSYKTVAWLLPCAAAAGYLFWVRFLSGFSGGIAALYQFYNMNYDQDPSVKFALFIVAPLFWLAFVRLTDGMMPSEKLCLWYSTTVLLLCIVFFPYITYRFALTAVVLQVAMMVRAKNLSLRTSMYAVPGLILHLMAYAFIGKNVMSVFNG